MGATDNREAGAVTEDATGGAPAPGRPNSPLFRTTVMRVEDAWIDYNGHLNMAYYNVLFDRGVDEAATVLGLGPDYLRATGASFFTAEVHVCYLRELPPGAPVYSTFHLIDYDDKKLHFYQELFHAEEEWLSATSEQLSLHVDMDAKRTAPWPDAVREAIAAMHAAHAPLPRPERVGRSIGIRRR